MTLTLSELAKHLDGEVVGDPTCLIKGVSEIQNSAPNTITFLGNPIYGKYLLNTKAAAVIVKSSDVLDGRNGIVVKNPQLAMARALSLFLESTESKPLIHPFSIISSNARIGKDVNINAGAIIQDGVNIGDGSSIGSNTVIEMNVTIGKNCKSSPSSFWI